MVAIVSGNGFGLSTGSASTLGQAGVFGNPNLGNSKEGAYVNVANGNLVLQHQDDFLATPGIDLSLTRTYNSQGNVNNSNGLNWRMGMLKQIVDLTGTVNTAGSTVTRINSDGSRELYRYDTARGHYISGDGGGAYNHLVWSNLIEWQWTSDHYESAGLNESYGSIASGGKIKSLTDANNNTMFYQYDVNNRLSSTTNFADMTNFYYDGVGNLTQIGVIDLNDVTSMRVHYTYDALNRLSQVITDLSPNDSSITDGNVYTTTYTYIDATSQVASVTQSDGTNLKFGYVQVGGAWKIETVTDGLGQVTRFAYGPQQTTVTDPLGNNTVYTYDAAGQLLSASAPPTLLNGATVPAQVTTFAYDANGNVLSITDPRGKKTAYDYDANGNRIRETNAAGDITTRTYDPATNNLLQESTYPYGSTKPALSTLYVYDIKNHLRFIVSPERRVTEYKYDYDGTSDFRLCSSMIEYSGAVLPSTTSLTELGLLDWSLSLPPENSFVRRTDYSHDVRGLVNKTSTYATTRYAMAPVVMPAALPAGIALNGSTGGYTFTSTKQATTNVSTATSTVDSPLGNGFHFDFTTPAQLAGSALTIGLTNQAVPAWKFALNLSGTTFKMLRQNGANPILQLPAQLRNLKANTTYIVDFTTDTRGNATVTMYEKSAPNSPVLNESFFFTFAPGSNLRLFAETTSGPNLGGSTTGSSNSIAVGNLMTTPVLQAASEVTTLQYVYDQHGQLLQTIDAKAKTRALFAYDGLGRLISAADADNNSTTTVYDDAGGSRSVTLSNGLVTKTTFDRNGRATSVAQLDKDGHVLSIATNSYDSTGQLRRTSAQNGAASYFLYDEAGRQTAKIDANGDLTAYFYNADNQVTRTIAYAKPLTPAQLSLFVPANGVWPRMGLADLRLVDSDADNRNSWNLYDDAGRLSKAVDAGGALTVYVYDQASRVTQVIRRAYDISKLANVYAATALDDTATADDQISRNYYTADGKLQLEIDPAGYVTEHRYNNLGQRIETLNYSIQQTATYLNQAPAANAVITSAGAVGSHERYFYNTKGQLTGTLDNGNFLTELKYDLNGNVLSRRHYAVAVTAPGAARMSDLGYAVNDADLFSSYTYTVRNQVETETAPGGIVTRYTYDKLGKLIETRVGTGATRAQAERYDLQGRLIADLNAEGVAALATAKPEDVDGIWLRYGSRYTYNENGLRLTATDQLGNQSRYYYDGQGNLTYTINAAGEVTGLAYNGFNQLKSKTNYGTRLDAATLATLGGGQNDANIGTVVGKLTAAAVDSVTRYEYDTSGHQTAVTDALGNRSTVHYDAFGRVDATEQRNNPSISAPAANPGGRNFYDINGRLKASLTSGGKLTGYTYNALDQLTDRITYAKPVDFAITAANLDKLLAAPAAQLDNLHDSHQRYYYDARGLTVAIMTAEDGAASPIKWAVVKNAYDGNGNLISRTAYASPLADAGTSLTPTYPANSGTDSIAVYAYDSANRLTATATAQSMVPGRLPLQYNWSVVRNTYDALGNLSARTVYATSLVGQAPSSAQLLAYAPASAADAATYYTYDSANRIKTVATAQNAISGQAQWAVTSRSYDAAGNLTSTTQYATPQVTASPAAFPTMAPVADPKNDRTTSYRYDALHRVQVSIDAAGTVTRLDYDARGNATQRTVYDQLVATPNAVTAAYNPAPQAADRITRTVYDLDNRPVYSIDALGQVTEQRYDAYGNVSATVQYAAALKASQLATLTPLTADIKTLLTATPGVDRLTRYSYDQQGRPRYTVDAAGYLKETVYNTLGQVSATREYLAPPATAFADPLLLSALATEADRQTAAKSVVVNIYDYDAMGNLVSSTDTLSNTERYTYDGQGRKISFTNKAGSTWTYEYDAAGHMIKETSPQVASYVADFNAAMGAWGAGQQQALVTALEYDMLGNLKSRTEASSTSLARTTTYRYDLVGRQTQTILAPANIYDDAADPKSITGAAASFEKSSGDRITTVRYNAFGNAVYNQDAAGNISYKVYDLQGQVRYDVDAMGYVTGYARNAFGEVTQLTRYNKPALGGSPTPDLLGAKDYAGRIQADADNDRTLRTAYDLLGRVVKSSEPLTDVYDQLGKTGPYIRAAKTTDTAYDRFGQVRAQSVYGADALGNRTTLGSETRSFYDLRGNLKAQVSALSASADGHTGKGYFTTYAYEWNGSNRTVTQTEYSQAADWNDTLVNGGTPPGAPVDTNRTTKSVYDLANRLLSQAKVGAKFFRDGAEVTGDIATTYAYDKLGNQVLAADALGGQVYTYYDKLGRVTAIARAQAPGVAEVTAAAPSLTEFKLDLLGNTAVRIDYANIYGGAPTIDNRPTGDAANFDNRVTMTHYNLDGRAIEVLDPEQFNPTNPRPAGVPASIARTSYDVLGRAAKQWRTVSVRDTASNTYTVQTTFQIAHYDALGRLKDTVTPAIVDLIDNAARPNVVKSNDYNAFGEVIATYITEAGGALKQLSTTKYDQAGRAWFSNAADGIDTVTLFSAQGQATAQIRSTNTDPSKLHELSALGNAMAARDLAQQLRTDTQYDLRGNVIDSSRVSELNTVLVWFNGAWTQVPSTYGRAAIDSLIVIGQREDAGKTIEVQYRLKPDGAWLAAGADRVQWLDGTPVFSTGGLASGDYEYQVKLTPAGGSSYQSRMGGMHIAEVDTTAKNTQLVALYLMLMGRAPDPATLNLWVGKYNLGATLTQLAGELYATAEAVTLRGNDNGTAVKQMLAAIGRPLPSDPGYQAKLDLWTGKLNQAVTPAARGQVVRALFDDAGTALDLRAKAVTNYLVQGGSDPDAAARLLTLAGSAPDGSIAEGSRLAKAETQRVQLTRLYLALLGRAPDKGGFDYWINDLSNGKTLESIALSMLQDKESLTLGLLPTLTPATYNERLVQLVYLNLLGRMPSPAELSIETAALGQAAPPTAAHSSFIVSLCNRVASDSSSDPATQAARTMLFNKVTVGLAYAATPSPGLTTEQIVAANKAAIDAMYSAGTAADAAHKAMLKLQALALSAQASADATRSAAAATPLEMLRLQLARVYAVVAGRAPDAGGYAYWVNVLKSGRPGILLDIVNDLLKKEGNTNPALYPADLSDQQFVTRVFTVGMGLQPGSAALASAVATWVPAAANTTRGQLMLNIINAVASSTRPDEQAMRGLLNNKAAVGITYALNFGANDLAQGGAILSRVTATDISAAIDFGNSISVQALIDAALAASTAAGTAAAQAAAAADSLAKVNAAQTGLNTLQAAANGNSLAAPLVRATQLYVVVLSRGAPGQPGLDLGGITAMSLQMRDGMTDVQAVQSLMDKTPPTGYDAGKFVKQLYAQALGLDPAKDPDGVAKWTAAAALPENRAQVIAGLLKSFLEDPIADTYAGKRDIQLAQAKFHNNISTVLEGLSTQIAQAESAYAIAQDAGVKASAAAAAVKALNDATASNTDPKAQAALELSRFYVGIQNRGAPGVDIDIGGLNFWTRAYIQGTDPVDIARQMLEATTLPNDKVAFVRQMYLQVWGREPGADSNRWVSKLISNSSPMGYASVAVGIIRELATKPVSTEADYRAKAWFDTRVQKTMQAAALNAASEAAVAATDLSKKGGLLKTANSTLESAGIQLNNLNAVNIDEDSRVIAAASLAATGYRLKNASELQPVVELMVILGMPTDFNSVYPAFLGTHTGDAIQKDVLAYAGLLSVKTDADRAAFFRDLYKRMLLREPDVSPGKKWPDDNYWYVITSVGPNNSFDSVDKAWQFLAGARIELYNPTDATHRGIAQRVNFPAEFTAAYTPLMTEINRRIDNYAVVRKNVADSTALQLEWAKTAYAKAQEAAREATDNYNYAWSYNEVAKVADTTLSRAIVVQKAAATADVTAADSIAAQASMREAALSVGLSGGATLIDFKTVADAATTLRGAIGLVKSLETGRAALADANVVRTDAIQAAAGASAWSKQVRAIAEIYTALFNENPSFLELNLALGMLSTGKSLSEIADTAVANRRNVNSPAPGTNDAFVSTIYKNATGHAPDNATLRALSDPLATRSRGTAVMAMINNLTTASAGADTQEFTTRLASNLRLLAAQAQKTTNRDEAVASLAQFIQANNKAARDDAVGYDAAAQAAQTASAVYAKQITQLYLVLLGRSPEPAALAARIGQRAGGTTLQTIAKDILESAESRFPSSLSNYAFAEKLYALGFGRPGVQSEINLSFAKLNTMMPREQLVVELINELSTYSDNDVAKIAASTALNLNVAASLERSVGETASFVSVSQLAAQRSVGIESSALLARMTDGVVLGRDSVGDSLAMRNTASITRDRWGNVLSVSDARDRNYKVNYRYNIDNQQISQSLNARDTDANVAVRSTGYDALGRQVRSSDFVGTASGSYNRLSYDSNGNVVRETHADGGVVGYTYDLFGNRKSVTTERGADQLGINLGSVRTNYAYDHLGHLVRSWSEAAVVSYLPAYQGQPIQTSTAQAAAQLVETYLYDELGRNILHVDAAGAGASLRYDFDGNIIQTVDGNGNATRSTYDAFHHKTATLDAENFRLNWVVDNYGRVTQQSNASVDSPGNMAGTTLQALATTYQFDAAGRKLHQGSSGGQSIDFSYTNGLLTRITDNVTGLITNYRYDQVGNRLSEVQSYGGGTAGTPANMQRNALVYDMQNRVTEIADTAYKLNYEYDDNGNRTRVTTDYGQGKLDSYNSYDAMNRQQIVNGDKVGGKVSYGANGHLIRYDWAGNRVQDTFLGKGIILAGGSYQIATSVVTSETYRYDAVGRLTTVLRDNVSVNTRRYDRAGRVAESGLIAGEESRNIGNLDTVANAVGASSEKHIYAYDAAGHLMAQRDEKYVQNSATGELLRTVLFGVGYDKAGNLHSYTVAPAGGEAYTYVITYSYTDGYREANNTQTTSNTSNTSRYDVNGNRTSVTDRDGKETTRLWYDAEGHVQFKHDAGGDHFSLIVNGSVLGEEDKVATNVLGSTYVGVTSPVVTAAPSSYSVQGTGETLQTIAQAVWGDSKLWYLIAEANGIDGTTKLDSGRILRIPTRVNTLHNDYATFKPYDAAEAMGSTTPAPPPPSHGGGCGGMGTLIMVVVAVAVTYITAGAAANAIFAAYSGAAAAGGAAAAAAAGSLSASLSLVAGGAIGAAAGSIASQAVGIGIGAQDGFNWKGVAQAAIAGGITAGIGAYGQAAGTDSILNGNGWQAAAARATLSNAISQGVGVVTGLQPSFSWSNVAASAVGSMAGSAAGYGAASVFGAGLATATTSGFAAGVVASALRGGKINAAQIATDAFGNALGSSLAAEFSRPSLPDSMGNLPSDQRRHIQDLAMRTGADLSDPNMADRIQKISELKFAAGQDLSRDDVLDRTSDFLRLRNATDDQISQVRDIYANNKVLPLVGNVEALWNVGKTANDATTRQRTFVGKYIDNAMVGTGNVLSTFGEYVESNPVAKYALEGLDIVTGPAAYALRNFTPVGDLINAAQSKVTGYISGGLQDVGRTDIDAQNGGIGGTAMLSVGAGGFAGMMKGVGSTL
ncbi:DUF4214 domain-containing protein, partial [Duganella sp. HH101]|uniref:DUF4214 domain-containing protein n=1 Tax=Duganella sp. HH101 TaxID=1781066 RepID=UPI00114D299F